MLREVLSCATVSAVLLTSIVLSNGGVLSKDTIYSLHVRGHHCTLRVNNYNVSKMNQIWTAEANECIVNYFSSRLLNGYNSSI